VIAILDFLNKKESKILRNYKLIYALVNTCFSYKILHNSR
jgi:hypothetical protein